MNDPYDPHDPHRFLNTPPPSGPGRLAEEMERPPFGLALLRGWRRLCPQCGSAPAFRGYLKVKPECQTCGAGLGRLRADDFPPYITIVIVGHIIVPLILMAEKVVQPPTWLHMVVWPALTLAMTLALLRPVKGAVLGLMWFLRMRGDET